ncbi:hypothetical protein FA13DRAFT_1738056 [Coprinellus micaceus]|uniref:Uncharacterized protein n=1 Tax=Coprinellus micaceus TaxID=71717 RepID=A0A4Y7SV34_COPMI|nr:hypothetical protein FA13DRAFT_1738056 [Coprinellus micaceus]
MAANVVKRVLVVAGAGNGSGTGQQRPGACCSFALESWKAIQQRFPKPEYEIRAGRLERWQRRFQPFLSITQEELDSVVDTGIKSGLASPEKEMDAVSGKRGNVVTSAIFRRENGAEPCRRVLPRSLGRTYSRRTRDMIENNDPGWAEDENRRLDPESIAKVCRRHLDEPNELSRMPSQSYLYLVNQGNNPGLGVGP